MEQFSTVPEAVWFCEGSSDGLFETCFVNPLEKNFVEVFAKKAASLGDVMYFIDTAGASPNQTTPEHILELDMVGAG